MRGFVAFVVGIIALALVVCLAIFALQNAETRNYAFLGLAFTLPVWVLAVLAAVAGFLIGLLVVTPARASADASVSRLHGHTRRLEQQVAEARAANDRLQSQVTTLQAENGDVAHERDVLKARLEELRGVSARRPDTPQPATAERTDRAPADQAQMNQERTAAPTTQAIYTPGEDTVVERRETDVERPDRGDTVRETEQVASASSASQPGLGSRLRTLFGKPETATPDETPQGPTAPA